MRSALAPAARRCTAVRDSAVARGVAAAVGLGAGRARPVPAARPRAPRPPGAPPVAAAAQAPLRPFADVIKDAKRSDGVLTVWQKDDKVWLELQPSDLDQPFFLSLEAEDRHRRGATSSAG